MLVHVGNMWETQWWTHSFMSVDEIKEWWGSDNTGSAGIIWGTDPVVARMANTTGKRLFSGHPLCNLHKTCSVWDWWQELIALHMCIVLIIYVSLIKKRKRRKHKICLLWRTQLDRRGWLLTSQCWKCIYANVQWMRNALSEAPAKQSPCSDHSICLPHGIFPKTFWRYLTFLERYLTFLERYLTFCQLCNVRYLTF